MQEVYTVKLNCPFFARTAPHGTATASITLNILATLPTSDPSEAVCAQRKDAFTNLDTEE